MMGMGAQPLVGQLVGGVPLASVPPVNNMAMIPGAGGVVPAPHTSPPVAAAVPFVGPGATSTPRSSVASLDKAASIESL